MPPFNRVDFDANYEWLSKGQMGEELSRCLRRLDDVDCSNILASVLDQRKSSIHKMTNCVCLGLGHFSEVETLPDNSTRNPALHQLAVLIKILEMEADSEIQPQNVYFQDPVFTSDEKSFLRSLGYVVKNSPNGFDNISRRTFLFAPRITYEVTAKALRVATPALYVGNNLTSLLQIIEGDRDTGDQDHYRLPIDRFRRRSSGVPMPDFENPGWVGTSVIRWLN